jgi:hypothetical protein
MEMLYSILRMQLQLLCLPSLAAMESPFILTFKIFSFQLPAL